MLVGEPHGQPPRSGGGRRRGNADPEERVFPAEFGVWTEREDLGRVPGTCPKVSSSSFTQEIT